MMYSDYFALSSCAIGVVFIPFMVACLLRYGLILQAFNYESRAYMSWLWCSFTAAWAPLMAVSGIALLWELVLSTYLTHTAATELQIIIGYAVLMLVGIAAVALAFGRFCRVLGGAVWSVPRIEDQRLSEIFCIASLFVGVLVLLLNLYLLQQWIYFVPVLTPLLVPLVNLCFRPYPGRVVASTGFEEEPLGLEMEDVTRIEREPLEPDVRPELQEEGVSQNTRHFRRSALPETPSETPDGPETERQVGDGENQDDHPAGGD